MRLATRAGQPVTDASVRPLPTLLSQVLVAFTIEFDNEFERQMPHRPTTAGLSDPELHGAPWLVSLVMWSNVMQYVGDEGITAGELYRRARISKKNLSTSLRGLRRWGYVTVKSATSKGGQKMRKGEWVIRPTDAGRGAQKICRPLAEQIEQRWNTRFGKESIERLRTALSELIEQFDDDLPEFFPVLKYGLFADAQPCAKSNSSAGGPAADSPTVDPRAAAGRPLYALLSKVLLAFTMDFERDSFVSLAISANILRVLENRGVPVRGLPRFSGVSRAAVKMSLGFLERGKYVAIVEGPGVSRGKLARLTAKGFEAKKAYVRHVGAVEKNWRERFGENVTCSLREVLEQFVGDGTAEASPLWRGLKPHAGGWRESVSRPGTLPHQPMVLYRGGYPDGS